LLCKKADKEKLAKRGCFARWALLGRCTLLALCALLGALHVIVSFLTFVRNDRLPKGYIFRCPSIGCNIIFVGGSGSRFFLTLVAREKFHSNLPYNFIILKPVVLYPLSNTVGYDA